MISRTRRRKTPETPIAARIRAYATGYEADGRDEWAGGMRQAADLVDSLLPLERAGNPLTPLLDPPPLFGAPTPLSELEERVTRLEALIGGRTLSEFEERLSANAPPAKTHKKRSPAREPGNGLLSTPGAHLSTGEELILAALEEHGHRSSDELSALVGYRSTSLRTYLGNLRAAGFVATGSGRHAATGAGEARVAGHTPLPIGKALFEQWLEILPLGERTILSYMGKAGRENLRVVDLVGDATRLKSTSVRTYLGSLARRKLIVRPSKGRVSLAPILLEGETS